MLELTSIAVTSSSGMFSRGEVGDRLRPVVFEDPEIALTQAAHEASAVSHHGGDLHDVDIHFLRILESLRSDGVDEPFAGSQQRDRPDLMFDETLARVPVALEGRLRDDADLVAVGEERDL